MPRGVRDADQSLEAELVQLRVTGCVAVPVQPPTIEAGSIASLNVKLIVSPASSDPAVPPATFVVVTFVAVGAVVSIVNVLVVELPTLPALSLCVAWTV